MKKIILILVGFVLSIMLIATSEKIIGDLELSVTITGIKDISGDISIGLYKESKGWLDNETVYRGALVTPYSDTVTYTFRELPKGNYGIAILHDENRNKKMDLGLFGIPKEGYAFSNNVFGLISEPSFQDASFFVDKDTSIHIQLKY